MKELLRALKRWRTNRKTVRGTGNTVTFPKGYSNRITVIGNDNVIDASAACLSGCIFRISGNNNRIILGKRVAGRQAEFHIEDDGNVIHVDENTTFSGKVQICAIEGTQIEIGKDCMFSAEIVLRSGDSHTIINTTGQRINPSKNIKIGNHCWIGYGTMINKGGGIADFGIVGNGTIVTKFFEKSGIILAGNPAREIRSGINWMRKRI